MKIRLDRIRTFLSNRPRAVIKKENLTHAGVLMLLFLKGQELHLLLTKRTSDVEHHKGQISFPGGSVDSNDEDIVMTALRETEEEIGLPPKRVEVLGIFDDSWTPSGFRITPVIGYVVDLPELILNPDEVEEVLEVPLAFFNRTNEEVKQFIRDGEPIDVYFYKHGANEIWGATAGMIRSFLQAYRLFEQEQ